MITRVRGGGEAQVSAGESLRCAILTKQVWGRGGTRRVGPGRVNSVHTAIKCLEGSVL